MKKLFHYPFLVILLTFFIFISLTSFLKKDTKFSELENRYLAERPTLNWKNILDSSFSSQYETYINEQFPFRNNFISTKALSEMIMGKQENNNIIRGKNNYLFQKALPENNRLEKNLLTIKQFGDKIKQPVYFSVIPNSYSILKDKLPKGAPITDQEQIIDNNHKLFSASSFITYLNLWPLLKIHNEEYLYYKTDHHWTTLGAYYAYMGFCEQEKLTPVSLNTFSTTEISPFYGTYYAKYKGIFLDSDTITCYNVPINSMEIGNKTKNSLYDWSKTKTYDKYALFLYGNNALSIIHSDKLSSKNNKKILLIKDSYANSLIPFLTLNYNEIYVVDLRFYQDNLTNLIKENKIDTIWILYNYDTLINDNHLYRLN